MEELKMSLRSMGYTISTTEYIVGYNLLITRMLARRSRDL